VSLISCVIAGYKLTEHGTKSSPHYNNKSVSKESIYFRPDSPELARFLIINIAHFFDYDHSDFVLYLEGLKRNFSLGKTYEAGLYSNLKGC
jgi:hypothetical protein